MAEKLFTPLVDSIVSSKGMVYGNRIVTDIQTNDVGDVCGVVTKDTGTGDVSVYEVRRKLF